MYVKTRDEARRAGKHLKGLMKRGRWKVRVWENRGWHYQIEAAGLAVSPTCQRQMGDGERYFCMFGPALWTDDRSYQDPNMAVTRTLNKARRVVAEDQRIITQAAEAAGQKARE